ncbi:hypothetical protein C8R44DRAFT_770165 [Mycena epipterygia]|nr:hypothetical protein C8R44DRAFT_770165 [Mycena epipterygia]
MYADDLRPFFDRFHFAIPITLPVPAHRKRFYLSSYTLGIELLRYKERHLERMPREWRLCRFCFRTVESESHAQIPGCSTTNLRRDFSRDVYQVIPEFTRE